MNTIILNTLTGAVSEYDWAFQSITPTHAGSASGLCLLGGDTDNALPIVSTVTTGKTTWGGTVKKFIDMVYFALKGTGTSTAYVGQYGYSFPVRTTGESRVKPGKGIRDNYLAFGYSNTDGSDFQLDRIEVSVGASTRRV